MKRTYLYGETENAAIFTGIEIEHTPQYGAKTLFVVGIQPFDRIRELAQEHNCGHIYLGANHSFDGMNIEGWDEMVIRLLKDHFWVTLDMDVRHVTEILESGYSEFRRFIPIISVKLPYVNQLGYNAILKIDDTGFEATNPGVWCHRIPDLLNPETFTDWDHYGNDQILDWRKQDPAN